MADLPSWLRDRERLVTKLEWAITDDNLRSQGGKQRLDLGAVVDRSDADRETGVMQRLDEVRRE